MGQLTIRDIDHTLLVRLKRKAWQEGLPLETFVRGLLRASVEPEEIEIFSTPVYASVIAEADPAVHMMCHA